MYILTNRHCTTLYIGITNNITRRLYQHRYGELDGFAKRYHLTRLVWLEHFRNVNDAIACEKKLKGWRRSRKIALIEEMNPRWLDLSDDWEQQPKFYLRPSLAGGGNRPRFFASLRMTLVKMELLAQRRICDTCGSTLDFEMPSGFCPGCLLNTVLETENETSSGSRINEYELLNEVARGGMGIVYRARQRTPSRIVALKMILPAHLNSLGAIDRFRAEAEAAASLEQEGILPIYAVGEADGTPFYSMKFAEGGTLSARIDNYRGKPRDAAALTAKLARAVAFAHEHGILHRDLKPGNVLFDSAGKAYVSDFGLAKWLQRECDLTQTLAILGTPYYMAPEQASDSRSVTAAADIRRDSLSPASRSSADLRRDANGSSAPRWKANAETYSPD